MSDGTISNNKYGVYNKGIFEMSNNALVAENNEVLLASDKFITLAGAINSGKGALNITHNSFSAGSTIVRGSSLSTPSTDNFKLNPSIVNFKLGVRGTDLKLCYNLTSDRITIVNKTYDGTTQNPDVKYNGNTITKDTDYTLSGDFDKTSAGDYTSTVTGIGNYEGTISGIAWNISKAAPIATDFTLNRTTAVFTGQPLAVDVTNNSLEGLGALTGPYYSGTNYPINLTPPTAIGTYTINITLAVGTNYTEIDNLTVGTFTITSSNPPAPVNNGGSSENTGNGKYSYYTRTIENNGEETADGIEIKFGTSPIVGSVILPKGSSGQVILHVYSTEDFPQSEADEYLFDITVGKTAEGQSQIKFKLPASLLKKYGINAQQIKLYHENKDTGVWELLKVEFSADGEYISFTGFTDSFSKFKIVMDRNAVAEETQTQTPAVTETETAKATQTNAEPEKPAQTAIPTQTQSPLGLIGLISALGTTVLVLRRK
ncbi:MAG: PGF-pre-PGF domain-containing protein [Methanocorpusculum sp.]|nr:PGF-pre-PGF domain-containing protein [Methanocorpusculum sp.]